MDHVLRRLGQLYGEGGPNWQPLDEEKALADYAPAAEVPDCDQVRAAIVVPPLPQDAPAVARLLEEFIRQPIDPWNIPDI